MTIDEIYAGLQENLAAATSPLEQRRIQMTMYALWPATTEGIETPATSALGGRPIVYRGPKFKKAEE